MGCLTLLSLLLLALFRSDASPVDNEQGEVGVASSQNKRISPRSTVTGCNRVYSGNFGYIVSPGWPGNYPKGTVCNMRISVESTRNVNLVFASFDLGSRANCAHDYLKIYDGSNTAAPLIGTFCGDRIPSPVLSLGSEVYLEFRSHASGSSCGFRIMYTA